MSSVPQSVGDWRVALVASYFWPERLGCAGHISDVAAYLKRTLGELDVFAAIPHYPSKRAAIDSNQTAVSELLGTKIRRAWVFDRAKGGFVIRVLNDFLFATQTFMACVLSPRRWDAVLVLVPAVLAVPAVRIANPRTRIAAAVYDIESALALATGLISSRRIAFLLGAIEAWCLNRADTLLVLTPQMHQHLESIGVKRPISVVPIWPSITGVAQTTERVHTKTLMYTGGLARRHGSHVLPELWRHLQRKVPECRLVLQGEDSQMGDTKKVLHAIGGHVSFRPTVHRDLLLRALQDGDLQLVLTSETGADACIPSKAITSLAAGVPFLTNAPTNSALAEFATKSGGGYVVPCGSPEALASAAAELLGAPGQLAEMGSSGHAYVKKIHSRDNILPLYLGLLRNKVD